MIRKLAALAVTMAVAYFVVTAAQPSAVMRPTALALGLALIAASITGELLERVRLPRVTGYLLFGMICGPYLANIITRPMARELQLINGLAVVVIAFIAGLEMNVRRLRPRLRAMFQMGGLAILIINGLLFGAFWLAWDWLGVAPTLTGLQKLAVAALLTTVVASFSPTVTIAVIAEARASGPLSELTLAVVILADLVLILFFTLVMQFVRTVFGGTQEIGLFVSLSWEIFGSFAFGAAAGALFALYLRYIPREIPVALLGLCVLIAAAGTQLHLEPLLAALAAGLVVENIAPPSGDRLKEAVERSALPILIVFFVAAGASLQLDALASIGGVALLVSVLRLVVIWAASYAGARFAGVDVETGNLVWMGLVSQAGVTLGLTLIVAGEFPTWGTTIQTLVVSLIALHQLVGPVLFRAALARAGEIGGMDAGSRPDSARIDAEPVHAD
jgi:Kef-type K+ transport system membrane component KefB